MTRLASLLIGLVLAGLCACQLDLAPLECTRDEECSSGQVCRSGLCRDDSADADADIDADTVEDPADDLEADADLSDAGGADTNEVGGDVGGVDVADVPVGPCPLTDCLEPSGRDRDGDGTDGASGEVVLVDPVGGDDDNDGSPGAPVASLSRAFELLTEAGRSQILLAGGRHSVGSPVLVADRAFVEIGGGYLAEDWSRLDDRSQILAASPSAMPVLQLADIEEVRLSQIAVSAASGTDGSAGGIPGSGDLTAQDEARSGQTSVAVTAARSSLRVVDSRFEAASGGRGQTGRGGRTGRPGALGTDAPEPIGGNRPGGAGAEGAACWDGRAAPRGGDGGDGHQTGLSDPGDPGSGTSGGAGGDLTGEATGRPGGPGGEGQAGVGGGRYGYTRRATWHSVPGGAGQVGEPGSGGGGGSSGFDGDGNASDPGGGGGSGACGGEGGGGGSGGGGSIGLYLEDAVADLDEASRVVASDGGAGGDGGPGGAGGDGRLGGAGWGGSAAGYDGGPGAGGGIGGAGGGGAGGLSVAVLLVGDSALAGGRLTYGDGGPGGGSAGAGLPATAAGQTGFAGDTLHLGAGGGDDYTAPESDCPYGSVATNEPSCPGTGAGDRTLCLDRWESARAEGLFPIEAGDGTTGQAVSLPGVPAWTSLPSGDAAVACARGGGALCSVSALQAACEDGVTASDCVFGAGAAELTGQGCSNADGVFDLLGNVEEWSTAACGAADPSPTYGGSYLDDVPIAGPCATTGSSDSAQTQIGFRCCAIPAWLAATEYRPPE